MKLYQHQLALLKELSESYKHGHKSVVIQAPTGLGKSVIAGYLADKLHQAGKKVLFLVHLKELIEQLGNTCQRFLIPYGYISASLPANPSATIQIGSTQTIIARKDNISFIPDWIIWDEFHHAPSKTGLALIETYKELNPSLKITGLTATPQRLDGKGLKTVADHLIKGPTTKWLIDNEYLSDFDVYVPPQKIDFSKVKVTAGDYNKKALEDTMDGSEVYGDVVDHYLRYVSGKQAICFCVSIKHSIELQNLFRARGVNAVHIDGQISKADRQRAVSRFEKGEVQVLTNCNLISEGFDVPNCNAIFLVRPTKSLAMYLQQVGRGLRKAEDGSKCSIFDHVGNVEEHGLPDEIREWTLEGQKKKKGSTKEQKVKNTVTCDNCGFTWKRSLQITQCPKCRFTKAGGRSIVLVTTQLIKLEKKALEASKIEEAPELLEKAKKERAFKIKELKKECQTLEDYLGLAQQLGYKAGWGRKQWELKEAYKKKWVRK